MRWHRFSFLASALVTTLALADSPAPTLEAISRETQSLYRAVKPGLVRIQFPSGLPTTQSASTQPIRLPSLPVMRTDGSYDLVAPGAPQYELLFNAMFSPRTTGIIVDEHGNVVVPIYIDPEGAAGASFKAWTEEAGLVEATFVGSDRQTNLSVLHLAHAMGSPVRLSGGRPPEGSITMTLAAWGEAGRLTIWTGTQSERGLVVATDGTIAGFARSGQFLASDDALPVIDQLIRYGKVRRAMLGATVQQMETPDGRKAMHVDQVMPNSPAERAGVKEGDFILSMGARPADDLPSFAAAISRCDGPTPIRILRGTDELELKVELHPLPN